LRQSDLWVNPLPAPARKRPDWWENETDGRHFQAHSWMNAGWKVEKVDLSKKEVEFGHRSEWMVTLVQQS
jgi:hypothetical protein